MDPEIEKILLAQDKRIDDLHHAIGRFGMLLTSAGIVISVLVIIISFRSTDLAKAESRNVAQSYFEDTRDFFDERKKELKDLLDDSEKYRKEILKIRDFSNENALKLQSAIQKIVESNAGDEKDFSFVWPINGQIISEFKSSNEDGYTNDGINISAPLGTPVKASEAGVVRYAGEFHGYGSTVLIRHTGTRFLTGYTHLGKMLVKKGDRVKKGDMIGDVGITGIVRDPQLHFEIRLGAVPLDPMLFLK